jgi:hypothetical protein
MLIKFEFCYANILIMAQYFVIPEYYTPAALYNKNAPLMPKLLELATTYINENKINIKHGDLGRLQIACNMKDDYIHRMYDNSEAYIEFDLVKMVKSRHSAILTNSADKHYVYNSIGKCHIYDNIDKTNNPLVRAESAKTWNSYGDYQGYYRNEGLMIWHTDKFINLDFTIDEYGSLPSDFKLYEEPHYFDEKHWFGEDPLNLKDKSYEGAQICHNGIVWVETCEEMYDNIQVVYFTDEQDEKKAIAFTRWVDCRGMPRNIIFEQLADLSYENSVDFLIESFSDSLDNMDYVSLFEDFEYTVPMAGESFLYLHEN